VTVLVGRATETGVCRVVTMAEHVDEPRSVEFQLPKSEEDLKPGQPLWANYVKGVIAFFPYKGFSNCSVFKHLELAIVKCCVQNIMVCLSCRGINWLKV